MTNQLYEPLNSKSSVEKHRYKTNRTVINQSTLKTRNDGTIRVYSTYPTYEAVRYAAVQEEKNNSQAERRRPHAAISGEAARMNFLAAQGKTSTSLLVRPFHPGRTV